ncbi:hypothetical protein JXA70_06455 [candidate division KSB1 bacterium]|nr:hypothetical protein [candidate division KSB1 bacterium]
MNVSKTKRLVVVLLTMAVASLFLLTCSTKEVGDPLGVSNFAQLELTSLTNSSGLEKTTFYMYEDIFLSIDGLIPREQTNIEVIEGCVECKRSIKRAVVVTDQDGKITNLPIFYHVGVKPDGQRVNMEGSYTVLITQPPKHDPWYRYEICFDIVDDISPDPQIHAFDDNVLFKGKASLVGEDVYAIGYNINATEVKLLVVADNNNYTVGDMLTDLSGGIETVTPGANGYIPPTLVWPAAAAVGSYDIIADVAPFGEYNVGDVVSDPTIAGLVVQAAPGAADIVLDIACDMTGMHRDNFGDLEPLFGKVEPNRRPGDLTKWLVPIPHWVPVFVTPHKSLWNQGDKLVTIRTVGTHQMPAYVQMNERSGTIDLFRLRGETKPLYYLPLRLWPGDYDVIVDVNRNFVYDPGIDLLDGGPQVGFSVANTDTMPDVRLINTASEDILGRGSNDPFVFGQLMDENNNPISGIEVRFSVVLGPGYVNPTAMVTDDEGIAMARVHGLEIGTLTRVRTEAIVDGKLYYNVISFFRTLPCTHDQGHNQGHNQGFVSGP